MMFKSPKFVQSLSLLFVLFVYSASLNSCTTKVKKSNSDPDYIKAKRKMLLKEKTDVGGPDW